MMNNDMMWGMGFGHWIGILLILLIFAVIKYVFFR